MQAVRWYIYLNAIVIHSPPLAQTYPSNMTIVSDDSSWWPLVTRSLVSNYWAVAAGIVVVYDWVLTLGQEIELIWRQRWSFMTVIYLVIRYIGIPYHAANVLTHSEYAIGLADGHRVSGTLNTECGSTQSFNRCNVVNYAVVVTTVVVAAMLGVIMIVRLYVMYRRSRMMLISLIIIFLAVIITYGVMAAIVLKHTIAEELILSDTYMCDYETEPGYQLMVPMIWVLISFWEVLALCLSVWIAVKHFRDLRRLCPSTRSTIRDCFRVLIKSHVFYFASFACISCLQFGYISPKLSNLHSMEALVLNGVFDIFLGVQIFVLGPRLILSVREYHAKNVADSDAATSMTSIVFQEHVHVSTSSTV
ncbi:uncharacterized protein F5147DRAFT_776575 [Suillus discolor]|uniref:DUF6533 domain-containing protein n=1 Tax=Suillus discolor TaxID=1912936 RepID=A0A9P7F2M8_9AGAM|nr:uncharacterized protein F5147DRAFT_776575 [Suillus discolor]KAG2101572.1 hypothetical protein F5147DRAFT_776575 [Suillus discolor]